jgi:uncharacterized membrane protein HdeD (DUF308 family)
MSQLKTNFTNTDWLFLRNIICLAAGILLWLYPTSFAKGVVIGLGSLLVLYGVIAFLLSYVRVRRSALIHTATINAIVSLIVGLALIIAPSFFLGFFIPVIGVLAIGLSILQFLEIITLRKYSPSSALLFLSPLVILGLGIVSVIKPVAISTSIGYFAAAALIYSGLSGLYVAFKIRKGVKEVKKHLKAQQAEAQAEVKRKAEEKAEAKNNTIEEESQAPSEPMDFII